VDHWKGYPWKWWIEMGIVIISFQFLTGISLLFKDKKNRVPFFQNGSGRRLQNKSIPRRNVNNPREGFPDLAPYPYPQAFVAIDR
jgi:hypothetical protein